MAKKQTKSSGPGRVFCLSNHKGGVAKTCSAINIGAGLGQLGKKCLLIDLDPQANLTLSLGLHEPENTVYEALRGECNIEDAVVEITPRLHVIPSHIDLSAAEVELSTEAGREFILKEMIDPLKDDYDYIILDCPPSLGLLTVNALTAAESVMIPVQAQYLAMQGVTKLHEVIEKVQKRLNKELTLGGVIVTQFDKRKILNRDVAKTLTSHMKGQVFKTRIRENVALAEAPSAGLDIFRYNPNCNGAEDYLKLSREIIRRLKSQ